MQWCGDDELWSGQEDTAVCGSWAGRTAQKQLSREERDILGVEEEEEDYEVFVRRMVEENMPDALKAEELQSSLMEDVKKGNVERGAQAITIY